MNKWRKKEFSFSENIQCPVTIVSDAAVSSVGVADGRLIPVLIIDTTDRSDIDELVQFHDFTPAGDVQCAWGSSRAHKWKNTPTDLSKISLFLEFERPCETFINIEFDVRTYGTVIDTILSAKALYLQPGKEGDRLSHDINCPKIGVEVADTGFGECWDKLWRKSLTKKFKHMGFNRSDAKKAADKTIQETRKMYSYRMSNKSSSKK
ncbi:MAG: hypothetical protein ACRBDL_06230 [Alphaproteobacteria bacterium]